MTRVEAVERTAYGLMCDYCKKIIPTRNSLSKPEGYYLDKLVRVTRAGTRYDNEEPLFFCDKDCLVEAMRWRISHLIEHRGKQKETP